MFIWAFNLVVKDKVAQRTMLAGSKHRDARPIGAGTKHGRNLRDLKFQLSKSASDDTRAWIELANVLKVIDVKIGNLR